MKKILQLNCSILGDYSVSKRLSDYTIKMLKHGEDFSVNTIDVTSLPHLNADGLTAFSSPDDAQATEFQHLLDLSNQMINELKNADIVVIGVPMYNFHIPSQLKSFFDFVMRKDITFKYTEKGPVGLLDDKKVYLLTASGGVYLATGDDLITGYLKKALQFIGITDTHFFYAEGLDLDQGENKEEIITNTQQQIKEHFIK